MLPGVHRVRRELAGGQLVEFWYAWRSGPRILRAEAKSHTLLAAEVARLVPAAAIAYQAVRGPKGDRVFFYGLVTRYLDSPAYKNLSERTQSDRRKHLDFARGDRGKLGKMEIKAFEARGARAFLLRWRDSFAATPKTADERLNAVSIVLQWAVDQGELRENPVRAFARIYECDRAEVIWTPADLNALLPHCSAELAFAVQLAAFTGLRLGDLLRLPWSAIGEHAIAWQTGKSRGRRTAVIPILPELRKILDAQSRPTKSLTVLNSSKGRPWTPPGIGTAFRLAKIEAEKARPGVKALRFHDLRGTAATYFVRGGLSDDDVATILAWSKDRVQEIKRRYVSAEAIGLAIVDRLRKQR